ncbi:uncharacterized protein LOC131707087 isoform X1 [Acipenser ruthenus]|uniref:uncharacterized protein LOC131707087 isoform X1 n=1 Tax=Acipenser ruthenus TaxID=7906 RepID=UPI0027409375|nr:uncharacterized protein LOC131707087 isoform X1 [Acipenser ruthenus]
MYRSIMILPFTIPVAFFILCAASAVQSTFLVHQSPAILRAAEGTRVILNCTFQSAGTLPSVGQASWWRGRVREGQLVSNSNWVFKGRVFVSELELFLNRSTVSLQIAALQRSDAGVYYCEVEFLQYATRYGGGTTLEVIGKGDKDEYPPVYQYPLIIEANEGEAAEIVCVCYGSPECPDLRLDLVRVSAGKEVSELSSSLRRRTESRPLESYNNASEVCVRVTGLEYSDSGEYKCRGYSGSGSVIVSGNATTVAVKINRCLNSPVAILNGAKIFLILVVTIELCALAVCRKKTLPPLRHQNNSNNNN